MTDPQSSSSSPDIVEPCAHFSLVPHPIEMAGLRLPMTISSPACAISDSEVDSPHPGFPPTAYGPDAAVVSRAACTADRFTTSCDLARLAGKSNAGHRNQVELSEVDPVTRARHRMAAARVAARAVRMRAVRGRGWARKEAVRARELADAARQSVERARAASFAAGPQLR